MSVYESLKLSVTPISHKRFKIEFEKFVNNYMMYNFNILKAVEEFETKFNSYEFNMFLSILIQGEKEGNMLEGLETFNDSLDLMYFKYLKLKASKRLLFVSFATIISLINSFVIVMYPIAVQVSSNLTDIFK
ncbi:MAG: hypothetical protein RSD14_01295 [Clostridia bacterium]